MRRTEYQVRSLSDGLTKYFRLDSVEAPALLTTTKNKNDGAVRSRIRVASTTNRNAPLGRSSDLHVAQSLQSKKERIALNRSIRALRKVAASRRCNATTVIGTVLTKWIKASFPKLPRPAFPFSRALNGDAKIVAFVEELQALSLVEATYWASSLYATLVKPEYRQKLAMFFTPPSLTKGLLDDLADQGVDFHSHKFVDPACGGAAFLVPIAIRIRDALAETGVRPKAILKHIERHLFGRDMDPVLCRLSKCFLRMALYEEIRESSYTPKFQVYKGNSLTKFKSMFGTVDVVVCNPPYRKMAASEISAVKRPFSEVIETQSNLYGLFIGLCILLLREDGYAGLVTPTSFLSGQYFRRLRTFLEGNSVVKHIGMVSDRGGVFMDVEQETALTVFRKRSKSRPSQRATKVSVVSVDGKYIKIGGCVLPSAGLPWPIPRSVGDVAILRETGATKFRISDYGYRVRIGSYVWNRDKRPRYESIKAVKRAKAITAMPLLWSRDISAGRYVRFNDLKKAKEEHRFVDLSDKYHTSVIRKPSLVVQRVTSNDQPRRLVAAAVPRTLFSTYGGFVGENHVVILEQDNQSPVLNVLEMAKLLGTTPVDRYFRCISGATNVSAFELRHLLLPNPTALRAKLEAGYSMEEAACLSFGIEAKS